jgi:hypothetical protein
MEYVKNHNVEKAKDHLINILKASPKMKELLSFWESKNNTELDAYMVDKFLALFAYEDAYEGDTIKEILE